MSDNLTIKDSPEEDLAGQPLAFAMSFESLILSTCHEGIPHASYAPFVRDAETGYFYIHISDLAKHSGNIKANPLVSILFLQSEDEAANIFARQRLTFDCQAAKLELNSSERRHALDLFSERFGKFFGNLRDLTDFHTFRLTLQKGTYVLGFAKAYHITDSEMKGVYHLQGAHNGGNPMPENA